MEASAEFWTKKWPAFFSNWLKMRYTAAFWIIYWGLSLQAGRTVKKSLREMTGACTGSLLAWTLRFWSFGCCRYKFTDKLLKCFLWRLAGHQQWLSNSLLTSWRQFLKIPSWWWCCASEKGQQKRQGLLSWKDTAKYVFSFIQSDMSEPFGKTSYNSHVIQRKISEELSVISTAVVRKNVN